MIELGGGNISILYADGTSAFFDPGELRLRLEKSFLAAGRADVWIAGEMALAVEYALRCRAGEDPGPDMVIRAEDIDECVMRILEDSGYPDAAARFKEQRVTSGDFGKLSPETVESYLAEKLQLTGPAGGELAARVRQALDAIGIRQCSPHLVLELARHFRDSAASAHRLPAVPVTHAPAAGNTVPAPEGKQILNIRLSEKIFPSIRAEIDLKLLFEDCPLTPPLTELSLIPILLPVADQVNAECVRLRQNGTQKRPLVLTFRGFAAFARQWLCYDSSADREILAKRGRAFSACFHSLLREKPFKTFLR